jgi:hypothetical protein
MPPFDDGCDHNYGVAGQCVPANFPPGVTSVTDKCAWLHQHGFTGSIPIAPGGVDRQGLDPNHDGLACDPGD